MQRNVFNMLQACVPTKPDLRYKACLHRYRYQ